MLLAQQEFLRSTMRHYDLELVVVESALPDLTPLLVRTVRGLGADAYLTVLSEATDLETSGLITTCSACPPRS